MQHIPKSVNRRQLEGEKGLLVGIGRWLFKVLLTVFVIFALVCILKMANDNPREGWVAARRIMVASVTVFALISLGKYIVRRLRPYKKQAKVSLLPRQKRTGKKLLVVLSLLGMLVVSWGFYVWHFQTLPQAAIHLIAELEAGCPGGKDTRFFAPP